MDLAEVRANGNRILDEIGHAVVGKRDVLELMLMGLLADGHVLLEDVPGLAKTLAARSFAAVTGLGFSRVQFTPDLLPSDVTGSSIWNQRDADFEFRLGPDLRQPPPRRRDQPRPAEDAGGAARGDAGAPGHRGRHDARAGAAVSRPRHAEPDRVRGHLPAARGAARPVPAQDRLRLSERGRRVGDARPADRAARGRGRAASTVVDRATLLDDAGCGRGRPRRASTSAATRSRSCAARARARASRSARARAAAWRCSSSRAAAPRWQAETSSRRTT